MFQTAFDIFVIPLANNTKYNSTEARELILDSSSAIYWFYPSIRDCVDFVLAELCHFSDLGQSCALNFCCVRLQGWVLGQVHFCLTKYSSSSGLMTKSVDVIGGQLYLQILEDLISKNQQLHIQVHLNELECREKVNIRIFTFEFQ